MSNPMELVFDEARRRELFNGLPCELTANVGAIRQHYLVIYKAPKKGEQEERMDSTRCADLMPVTRI